MKVEQTECSETLAYKIRMPGNYPEESIQHKYLLFLCVDCWTDLLGIYSPLLCVVTADVLYVQASSVCDSMAEYISALGRVTEQLETYRHPPPDVPPETSSADIIDELERSCGIFKQKLTEQARHMAWVSSKLCGRIS